MRLSKRQLPWSWSKQFAMVETRLLFSPHCGCMRLPGTIRRKCRQFFKDALFCRSRPYAAMFIQNSAPFCKESYCLLMSNEGALCAPYLDPLHDGPSQPCDQNWPSGCSLPVRRGSVQVASGALGCDQCDDRVTVQCRSDGEGVGKPVRRHGDRGRTWRPLCDVVGEARVGFW